MRHRIALAGSPNWTHARNIWHWCRATEIYHELPTNPANVVFYIPNVMCTSVFLRIECLHDRENWENSKFSDRITKILCDKISRNYSLEHLICRANQLEVCHIDCFIFLWNRLCQLKTKRVKGTFWCRDCYSNSWWRDSGRETLRHWDVSGNKLSHCLSTPLRCKVNSLWLEKHRSHIFLK